MTVLEAQIAGYRNAAYADCPDVLIKLKNITEEDFQDQEEYGVLMLFNSDIRLIP